MLSGVARSGKEVLARYNFRLKFYLEVLTASGHGDLVDENGSDHHHEDLAIPAEVLDSHVSSV